MQNHSLTKQVASLVPPTLTSTLNVEDENALALKRLKMQNSNLSNPSPENTDTTGSSASAALGVNATGRIYRPIGSYASAAFGKLY